MAIQPDSRALLFETLVKNAQDIITLTDYEGIILFQTESIEGVLGYRADELVGRNVFELLHEDDVQAAIDSFQRTVSSAPERPRLICRFRHKTEGWRHIEVVGKLLPGPEIEGVQLHTRDVTGSQEALLELRRSEELFQAAFNASGSICTLTDPVTGEYLDVNDTFIERTGWDKNEVIGRTANDIGIWGSPENRARIIGELQANGGQLRQHRAEVFSRTGERLVALLDVELLQLNDRSCMFLSAVDITQRELAEEQLRRSQKLEAIGQLTGGIAHDFNNLLSVITGHAELVPTLAAKGGDVEGSVNAILRAANSGAQLIQRMMAFSRNQNLNPETIDLAERIEGLDPLLTTTIGKDIRLHVEIAATPASVMVDQAQFDAALLNLVINARDALPTGGDITIRVEAREVTGDDEAALDLSPGSYLAVIVRDTGIGMDLATRERVFEPFYTTKGDVGGTGLGLSMVFGFTRQSGGNLTLDSAPGHGTAITMLLPALSDTATIHDETSAATPLDHGSLNVLVIEDNEEIRDLLVLLLTTSFDAEVTALESAEGLIDTDVSNIDLLVTDVMLPGTRKGPDIARHLSSDQPDLPVLFISGYQEGILSESDIEAAHRDFLQKPFTADTFVARVSGVLSQRQV